MAKGLLALCVMAPWVVAHAADNAAQTQVVSVSSVLHDKEAYLDQQYSPSVLPKGILDTVTQGSVKPVNFKRISINSKILIDKAGSAVPMSTENESLYVNSGRGFVKHLSITKVNGFEQASVFALSYRGFVDLRSQAVMVNATAMPPMLETTSITHFEAGMDGPHFLYNASQGYNTAGSAPATIQYECKAGTPYPAAQIHPDMGGSAHDVDCQSLNGNGIVISTVRYSYLEQYGLAIILHSKSASTETSKTVSSFKAE